MSQITFSDIEYSGRNPLPFLIPCHRVVAANGLGGFSLPGGADTKRALLELERADFKPR